jgi:hypothetical protein
MEVLLPQSIPFLHALPRELRDMVYEAHGLDAANLAAHTIRQIDQSTRI